MFIEITGDQPLPDEVDRDDVEDLLVQALGDEGSVTGAGTGDGRWHLDVEIDTDGRRARLLVRRLALALVDPDLAGYASGLRQRTRGYLPQLLSESQRGRVTTDDLLRPERRHSAPTVVGRCR